MAEVTATGEDEQIRHHLCRFGSVLLCGNIEQSVQIIILSRLKRKAHESVLSFVKSHFSRGANLDCDAIENLLRRFDTGWAKAFCQNLEAASGVREGIASCYAVRNSTAHGGSQSLGLRRLTELYAAHKAVIEIVAKSTEHWAR